MKPNIGTVVLIQQCDHTAHGCACSMWLCTQQLAVHIAAGCAARALFTKQQSEMSQAFNQRNSDYQDPLPEYFRAESCSAPSKWARPVCAQNWQLTKAQMNIACCCTFSIPFSSKHNAYHWQWEGNGQGYGIWWYILPAWIFPTSVRRAMIALMHPELGLGQMCPRVICVHFFWHFGHMCHMYKHVQTHCICILIPPMFPYCIMGKCNNNVQTVL